MQIQDLQRSLDFFGFPHGPEDGFEKVEQLSGKSILHIQKDSTLRRNLARTLTRAGASVFWAASSGEAKILLSTAAFGAILTDLDLLDESGISLLKNIRNSKSSMNQKIPLVALTSFSYLRNQKQDAGFELFLKKPASPLSIIHAVRKVIDLSIDTESDGA